MKPPIHDIEKRILTVLQRGFPRSRTPYKDMAKEVGIGVTELLEVLNRWKSQGKLRRIGAIVNHFKLNLSCGAMVVWQVEPERVEESGKILAGFNEVSHAYEREITEEWPYSIYTMVHGKDVEDIKKIVKRMSHAGQITIYRILYTEKELKKVPPTYFPESKVENGIDA